jgi:hypothetical protein
MCDERKSFKQSIGSIARNFATYYPTIANTVNNSIQGTAQAQLAADKAVSPEYAALQQQLYSTYGPEAAKTGITIDDLTQKAASARELNIAQTTGRGLVTEADLAQRKLDPEYYAQREGLSGAITKYLNANDPSLTETEREEMRRGMGTTSTSSSSAIDTAGKALQFGKAGQAKAQAYGNVITNVANAVPAMRSGISGFQVATGRQASPTTGAGNVGQVQTGTGSNTYGLASNFLGGATSTQQTRMGQQQSGLQYAQGITGSMGNV